MNRIDAKFKALRAKAESAFMPFATAGDPTLAMTRKLILAYEDAGADIVELGIPFSDPIADGPTIQKASERALKNKVSLQHALELVADLRKETQIPLAMMSYYNPIFKMGEAKFCAAACEAGVDGVIVPDLPPEEAAGLLEAGRAHDLATILLVAPTTPPERMRRIASQSTGFIYCVTVTGVTGARDALSEDLLPMVNTLREYTDKPICVGFGISTPAQANAVAQMADGVIVASAIINRVEAALGDDERLLSEVRRFASELAAGVKAKEPNKKATVF